MVVIHDVGLFSGYDATLHEGNAKMEPYDAAMVGRMAEGTAALIRRGQYPRIAIGHPSGAEADTRRSVGRVVSVRMSERSGVPTIVGDIEMRREDFDALIASNAFPRRSVEIFAKPWRIGAVALLGGDTPSSPVEDTVFSEGAGTIVIQNERTDFSETGIGGGSPTTPAYQWSEPMTDEMKKELKACFSEWIAEYMSEREKTEEAGKAAVESDASDAMSESPALKAAHERIAALERDRRYDFADRKVAEMSADGVCIPTARKEEIREWIASAGPENGEKIVGLVRDLCKGGSPTRRINMSDAVQQTSRRALTRDEASGLAAKFAGDTKGYLEAAERLRSQPA